MRFQLGVLCLLAGCTLWPTTSTAPEGALAAAGAPAPLPAAETSPRALPPEGLVLRIGVEHLPPDPRFGEDDPPRVEPARTAYRPSGRDADASLATERPLLELASSDDPLAQEALHFVSDLIEADRHRVRREVGLPFFGVQTTDPDRGPLLDSEREVQVEHEEWVHEHASALLRRPVRQLLKRLPLVRDVEVEFESFRSANVPLCEPWQQLHDRDRRGGRLSLRVHVDELEDPVEMAWVWRGLRIGSSQESGKLGFDLPFTDRLRLELRARTEYDSGDSGFRVDMSWRQSRATSWHLAVGDDMDFLSTSSMYSFFESPMDGAPGLVFYAVHVF